MDVLISGTAACLTLVVKSIHLSIIEARYQIGVLNKNLFDHPTPLKLEHSISAMRFTRVVLRSAGAIPRSAASKIISDAARRASTQPKARRSTGKYWDLIVLGCATIAAVTSLQRRRQYEEETQLLEAKLSVLESEQQEPLAALEAVKKTLIHDTDRAVDLVLQTPNHRAERLKSWIEHSFEKATPVREEADQTRPQPRII